MMRRELLHIWGPFSIYSYGAALALGLLITAWLCLRHPWRKAVVSKEKFLEIICLSTLVGLLGARLLFIINSWSQFESLSEAFSVWGGGLSVLGGIMALLVFLPLYLRAQAIAVLPFLDLIALYAPLMQSIARLGCFMAGCCHGKPTDLPWAITYTDPLSDAPLHIALHPSQLYMAISFLLLFFLFYFVVQKRVGHAGILFMLYLIGESIIRFASDFWRGDIEYFMFDTSHILSMHQWISLGIGLSGVVGLIILQTRKYAQRVTT